jgi:HSP20 family molecular chaperone IbpA
MAIFFLQKQSEIETDWQPRADVYRTPRGWAVKFDLAGVRPEDVTVQVFDCYVRVAGVRRDWAIQRDWRHHSLEITYSRFERLIELPCHLDRFEVSFRCQEGMLLVEVSTEKE